MPMSSATTGRSAMTGSTSTCSGRSTRHANTQRAGSGLTITNGRIWPWVASPRNRSWPSWPRLYFWAAPKKGGLPVEPIQRQVLWVGAGRSRETARAFFEGLPDGVCERIEAVAIDMTTAYELEIHAHCPQSEIVYDMFHVVAKYGREVIDRVRVDEANRLRQDRPARRVVKSARWLLLRNRKGLNPDQKVQLGELQRPIKPC